jgi:hypothetical protein
MSVILEKSYAIYAQLNLGRINMLIIQKLYA